MSRHATPTDVAARALPARARYDLIAFAASAGGLPALIQIVRALPADLAAPIVIVQHRSARNPEILPKILARSSALKVKLAEDGERLLAGTVYVAPPDYHLLVQANRTLHFTDGQRIKFVLSSANPLLESAAQMLEGRVIAVVLTGSGSDATDGVQTVKEMGGVVIAQNPMEAEHSSMPESAIRSGAVDYVLSIEDIAPLLVRLASAKDDKPLPVGPAH